MLFDIFLQFSLIKVVKMNKFFIRELKINDYVTIIRDAISDVNDKTHVLLG